MSITEQVNISTPAGLTLFNDTSIGNSVDTIKTTSVKLYYATIDNSSNGSAVYLKIFTTTAPASVVVGSTAPDFVIYIPASTVLTVDLLTDAASPGFQFNQASAICVTQAGTGGTNSPANNVDVTIAYV